MASPGQLSASGLSRHPARAQDRHPVRQVKFLIQRPGSGPTGVAPGTTRTPRSPCTGGALESELPIRERDDMLGLSEVMCEEHHRLGEQSLAMAAALNQRFGFSGWREEYQHLPESEGWKHSCCLELSIQNGWVRRVAQGTTREGAFLAACQRFGLYSPERPHNPHRGLDTVLPAQGGAPSKPSARSEQGAPRVAGESPVLRFLREVDAGRAPRPETRGTEPVDDVIPARYGKWDTDSETLRSNVPDAFRPKIGTLATGAAAAESSPRLASSAVRKADTSVTAQSKRKANETPTTQARKDARRRHLEAIRQRARRDERLALARARALQEEVLAHYFDADGDEVEVFTCQVRRLGCREVSGRYPDRSAVPYYELSLHVAINNVLALECRAPAQLELFTLWLRQAEASQTRANSLVQEVEGRLEFYDNFQNSPYTEEA